MASITKWLLTTIQLGLVVGASVSEISNITTSSTVTRIVSIALPSSAPAGRQVIDAAFQGYSIEFSYMVDYAGNLSCVL